MMYTPTTRTRTRTRYAAATQSLGTLASIAALVMACGQASAESSVVDFTYSPSQSKMSAGFGFGVYNLKDAGPGFYLNGSVSGSPDPYYASKCYSCGSTTSTQQGATLFSLGATFPLVTSDMKVPIYRTLHSYVGVGYGALSGYAQYSGSSYWYDYADKDESGVNANGGLIFGFDGFALNVGVNSLSKTVYFGIGIHTDKK